MVSPASNCLQFWKYNGSMMKIVDARAVNVYSRRGGSVRLEWLYGSGSHKYEYLLSEFLFYMISSAEINHIYISNKEVNWV